MSATYGFPKLSRIWLIAMRDFVGYVKTWGFWLSFLLPILGGVLVYGFMQSDFDLVETSYETVIDETGYHGDALIEYFQEETERRRSRGVKALARLLPESERDDFTNMVDEQGSDSGLAVIQARFPAAAKDFDLPGLPFSVVRAPVQTFEDILPYLRGEQMLSIEGESKKLNGVIFIRGTEDNPSPQYWSNNFNVAAAPTVVNGYFRSLAQRRFLAQGDLTLEDYREAISGRSSVEVFDPEQLLSTSKDEAAAVSMLDRMPFMASIGLSFFLLMSIFAGSFMLLTSMIEEKMNKLLEMMLASTRFSEIMLGKMLGAAMLTFASLAPYILLTIGGLVGFLFFGNPEQVAAIKEAFPASTILTAIIFLTLGYVFYASILIALGALAQSMQDAQTLSLPIMLVMFMGLGVIMVGVNAPDSPIVVFASIFPLTSPFAMMIRLAGDPPLWQVFLSMSLLAVSVIGVMWVCARVFRFGILSGSGVAAITGWFRRTLLRKSRKKTI